MNQHFDCGVARSMNVLGITNIMLTRSLDDLVEVGMISKKDFKTIPTHVEYSLTEKGKSLIPVMKELDKWGRENL